MRTFGDNKLTVNNKLGENWAVRNKKRRPHFSICIYIYLPCLHFTSSSVFTTPVPRLSFWLFPFLFFISYIYLFMSHFISLADAFVENCMIHSSIWKWFLYCVQPFEGKKGLREGAALPPPILDVYIVYLWINFHFLFPHQW